MKNLKFKTLNASEMKNVKGKQNQAQYDKCGLYIHYADGRVGWSVHFSYDQASSQWKNFVYNDGSYATGYCCKSCAD